MDEKEIIKLLKYKIVNTKAYNAKLRYLLFYFSNCLTKHEKYNLEFYIRRNNITIQTSKDEIRWLSILIKKVNKSTYKQLELNFKEV